MSRLAFPATALVVGLLVLGIGWATADGAARTAVAAGVGIGVAFQLALFALTESLLRDRRLVAFGIGMIGRFVLVAFTALVLLRLTGLPAAPLLFALVGTLFGTTLVEPVLLAADKRNKPS
ncbi:MAG TPA: hypothetical protein VF615_09225 [Longimicrobiaceae bacterium]